MKGLTWNIHVDKQHLFPGEHVTFTIHAENAGWLPVWLRLGIAADGPFQPVDTAASLTRESGLLWYQQVDLQWAFTAQRRGIYRIGLTSLRAGDLLAFFRRPASKGSPANTGVSRLIPLTGFSVSSVKSGEHPELNIPFMICVSPRDTGVPHSQPAKYITGSQGARYNRLQEKLFEPTSQEKNAAGA